METAEVSYLSRVTHLAKEKVMTQVPSLTDVLPIPIRESNIFFLFKIITQGYVH